MAQTIYESFLGTWELKDHDQLCSGASGMLLYGSDQCMSVLIRGLSKKDNSELLIAYAGKVLIKDGIIEHHVEVAEKQSRVSKIETRNFRFEKDLLELSAMGPDNQMIKVLWKKRSA